MSTVPATIITPPALILQRLGPSRGGRPLFDGLDLALHPGQLLWVQGANGSGRGCCGRSRSARSRRRTGAKPPLKSAAIRPLLGAQRGRRSA